MIYTPQAGGNCNREAVTFKAYFIKFTDLYESMPDVVPSDPQNGVTAVALYDYQAADEDELSFDPGDTITHIEKVPPIYRLLSA